jgi:hypothetical protein
VTSESERGEGEGRGLLSVASLPSARDLALGKDFFNLKIYFAECPVFGTRQRHLCRVPTDRYSAKNGFRVFAECPTADTRQRSLCRVPSLDTRQSIFLFFYFSYQTFCDMFLHYVDLHVPF